MQRTQASVKRGQNATFVVAVSTQNGSAADISVALTAAPSSQKPAFSSCTPTGKPNCTIGSVSDSKAVSLNAQIPVASGATSVSSVTLTATASVATTAKWTPPAAQETVTVTAAQASSAQSSASASPVPTTTLPLGPVPSLNGVSSSLIGAGNASGLFPAISPGATASPSPGAGAGARSPQRGRNAESVSYSSALAPVLTAQVAGLIALAIAVMLTLTRLSLRRRSGDPKKSS